MSCKIVTGFSAKFLEFPELLFASDANDTLYFDATHYIECKGNITVHSPDDFAKKFMFWFECTKEVYEINEKSIIVTDDASGHTLIDESLALLFVSYINPHFSMYIIERVSEMLLNGFVFSDSCIAQMADDRLNIQTIKKINEHEK